MEKVALYVKKILALILSSAVFLGLVQLLGYETVFMQIMIPAVSFLLFAYLDFSITGEKPRYLFGLNQSDTFLNKKGGFWNLFKWIVTLFGFLYDLVIWSVWGVFLLFQLFVDLLLLIKTIVFWIIHAVIWFIRQLFPPFIFLFKMFMQYLVNWVWWIYQLSVRNMKTSINKNYYFISLWGIIPALFIVFLFYAISQLVGIPQLVLISYVFAIIPLVWSFGEISALRHSGKENESYSTVSYSFSNGFEAVKSVLFYLIIIVILLAAEIALNLLGWIPNLSLSIIGITLNLNMAMSFLLVFLAILFAYADCMMPTHLLYHPEHRNDLNSTLLFLQTIGKKFLRYSFSWIPASFFGSILLVIPIVVLILTYGITDQIKDKVLDVRIDRLELKAPYIDPMEGHTAEIRADRMKMYRELPLLAPQYFSDLRSRSKLDAIEEDIKQTQERITTRKVNYDSQMTELGAQLDALRANASATADQINTVSTRRLDLESNYLDWEREQNQHITFKRADLKEEQRIRTQMPILYFFAGILFAVFGGIVLSVGVSYFANIYYELYNFREDGKPTYWKQVLDEIRAKDSNQPLLGFTFLVIILGVLATLYFTGVIFS